MNFLLNIIKYLDLVLRRNYVYEFILVWNFDFIFIIIG